jgi:hypothetical protein
MSAQPDISTRYLRITTRHHCSWATQIGASRNGLLIVFALVGPDGHYRGQVLMACSEGVELQPAVMRPDGLHLVREERDGASPGAARS